MTYTLEVHIIIDMDRFDIIHFRYGKLSIMHLHLLYEKLYINIALYYNFVVKQVKLLVFLKSFK